MQVRHTHAVFIYCNILLLEKLFIVGVFYVTKIDWYYSWVKKYDTNGVEGLSDKRGIHKPDNEVDELERLKRENLRLQRQLKEKDMLVELLKKMKDFERM